MLGRSAASTASSSDSATDTTDPGSGLTNIAASPIVLTRRTGGWVTSFASSASLLARLPSSCASISAPSRVNPTMSTKQTVIS